MAKPRVAVAMSGGVDSSMAAALLLQQGYDVIGITQQIWVADNTGSGFEGCCGIDAIDSARRVAGKLGIPFYVMDFRDVFREKVIVPFCREYEHGRTPNPCVSCNRLIRFGLLLDKVLNLGQDYLATGHYARIENRSGGYHLMAGVDEIKDQSYFLYGLGQSKLKSILFPVGNFRKDEVRRLADELRLPSADRPDSQDICFVEGDYRSFISKYASGRPGDILDERGKVLGQHCGLSNYTIGQRHGLRLALPEPLYVLKIDIQSNNLVVGKAEDLLSRRLFARDLNWISGNPPTSPVKITAKIRYRAAAAAACLEINKGTVVVNFDEPQRAVTAGQSVVFYHGDEVMGGGIIDENR